MGKHTEHIFEKRKYERVVAPLDMVHLEVTSPFPTLSLINSKYDLTFIEDYTIFCWVYFLKNKSEVFEIFPMF